VLLAAALFALAFYSTMTRSVWMGAGRGLAVIVGLALGVSVAFLREHLNHTILSAEDVEEWDSLLQISIVVAIEKEFGVRFRVGEVEATRNVGEFADLILRRLVER
jgi:acyl carrier protein